MKLYRFGDLREAGIVRNWPQLRNLQDKYNFPRGFLLSANSRVWPAEEIEGWVEARRAASQHAAA